MGFWEFIPYIEVFLAKLAIESGLAALLLAAVKNHLSSNQETRGIINEHMASYASMLKIKCPQCKRIECWEPIATKETTSTTEVTTKNINNKLNL